MKKLTTLIIVFVFILNVLQAQNGNNLPDGTVAPDFTAADINGNVHNLYDLLNAGKVVYLNFFSYTGFGYHYSRTDFTDFWNERGPNGTDEAYCFFIEGDYTSADSCLYGSLIYPGCCVMTNWVEGVTYPIINSDDIAESYDYELFMNIIYCVCPADKKLYQSGTLHPEGLWNFAQDHCITPEININISAVTNAKCRNTQTGGIDIEAEGGNGSYTYLWSNGATTQDLTNIPAGSYSVSISSYGKNYVSDFFEVTQPEAPLTIELTDVQLVGCNGVKGEITAQGVGGWNTQYTYHWSNDEGTPTISDLEPGTYRLSVTDAEGCQATMTHNLAPAVYPSATIASPDIITCSKQSIQLNGSGSSSGPEFTYAWTAVSGGHIVSGSATSTPTVDAAGIYLLVVTNTNSTCTTQKMAVVNDNLILPDANAGASGMVTCIIPNDTLSGTASSGTEYSYLWTGPNILSGATTLSPVIGAPGTYTLTVKNATNGCQKSATTSVLGQNTAPTVNTVSGIISCLAPETIIQTTTNSSQAKFAWTGPNGFSSNQQNPLVSIPGAYQVVITDTLTQCVATANPDVLVNLATPQVSTNAGTLTCTTSEVMVTSTCPDSNATYAWTGPDNFSSTLPTFSVGTEGIYNLVVTDPDNGCTMSASAHVQTNTTPPVSIVVAPGNLNCNTQQVTLDATPSSQGPAMTYHWTTIDGHMIGGENTLTPVVDASGDYILLILNTENGCSASTIATVIKNEPVNIASLAHADVLCHGGATGIATVLATGGSGAYTYNWSNGATTAEISSLSMGSYTVMVTDNENCTASATVQITQPDLAISFDAQNADCGANPNGKADLSIAGGTAPFTFQWSNGATTQNIQNLTHGNYVVSILDAAGCTYQAEVSIGLTDLEAPSVSAQNATMELPANGEVVIQLENIQALFADNCGIASTVITPNSLNCANLGANLVTLIVTDEAGLSNATTAIVMLVDREKPVLKCPADLSVCSYNHVVEYPSVTVTDNCLPANTDCQLVSGLPNQSEFPTGTSIQTYATTDQAGNEGTCSFAVTVLSPIQLDESTIQNDQNNQGVGAVNISVSGGNGGYTFEWLSEGVVIANTEDIIGLLEGQYDLIVKDNLGCQYNFPGFEVNNSVATKEPAWLGGIQIQPNPTPDLLKVTFAMPLYDAVDISIIDAKGREVKRLTGSQSSVIDLDCSAFPAGVYVLRFYSNNEVGVRKFSIAR